MRGESKKSSVNLEGFEASLFIEEELKSYTSQSPNSHLDLSHMIFFFYGRLYRKRILLFLNFFN